METLEADADAPSSHEFTGVVTEVGSGVKNFEKGDHIVSPFTVSWSVCIYFLDDFRTEPVSMECFYCKHGYSSRCEKGLLFGSVPLDGAQAQYVDLAIKASS